MTEEEWNNCSDPEPMLKFLRDKASDRKKRLFAVACCRYIWRWISDELCRKAVEAAELYADGKITHRELEEAMWGADAASEWGEDSLLADASCACFNAARCEEAPGPYVDDNTSAGFALKVIRRQQKRGLSQASLYQCSALRDIYGNPFRRIIMKKKWVSSTAKRLAETIYEERAFSTMPIFGDALEEAGCSDADILNHCRQPGEHVRGCWVVDLILGKS